LAILAKEQPLLPLMSVFLFYQLIAETASKQLMKNVTTEIQLTQMMAATITALLSFIQTA